MSVCHAAVLEDESTPSDQSEKLRIQLDIDIIYRPFNVLTLWNVYIFY